MRTRTRAMQMGTGTRLGLGGGDSDSVDSPTVMQAERPWEPILNSAKQ